MYVHKDILKKCTPRSDVMSNSPQFQLSGWFDVPLVFHSSCCVGKQMTHPIATLLPIQQTLLGQSLCLLLRGVCHRCCINQAINS